jgi:cardiolipin-specific phospholipase
VLQLVPFLREAGTSDINLPTSSDNADPHGGRLWRKTAVPLGGPNLDRFLNEYSVERAGEDTDEALVMLHGYGAGLGFFYKNFEPLSRAKGWRLYALDMLGMGNSARPGWHIASKDPQGRIDEAEAWFVDSLEEWRKARKLERFTLMGHSLGGYMATSYALKYPGRVKKLILVSPVGFPEDPYAVNAEVPGPGDSTVANEFIQDQESIVNDGDTTIQPPSAAAAPAKTAAAQKAGANGAPRRRTPGWLAWLWDANFSPFAFVRIAGPLGPRFVSSWTSRRFSHLPSPEQKILHDYSFSIFRQRGSGEYALPYVLAPGAYARRPLINRISGIGRGTLPEDLAASSAVKKETGIPIVFMYGEHDWMDVAGGLAAEEKLKQARLDALRSASPEEARAENSSSKVVVVQHAGHHLYIDNADEFNAAMLKELEDVKK